MKYQLLALSLLFAAHFATAQTEEPTTAAQKQFKNILEVDATGVLYQLLQPKSNYFLPYTISYKRFLGEKTAVRVGTALSEVKENLITIEPIGLTQKTKYLNIGLGFEHHLNLSKRWGYFVGADLVSYYRKGRTFQAGTLKGTNNVKGLGVSPLVGLQFKISPRFSLSAETSCLFSAAKREQTNVTTGKQTNTSFREQMFYVPAAVKFRVHF